jgi:hypothetical protein
MQTKKYLFCNNCCFYPLIICNQFIAYTLDELLGEREKTHLLQEEVETTLKDLQSM